MDKEVRLGDVEGDWKRLSDGEGIKMDGIRHGMDGTASSASGESKRLDTRLLAETDSHQQIFTLLNLLDSTCDSQTSIISR